MGSKKTQCGVAIIVLVCFFAVGCVGPFSITRSLGRWNAQVGNKWEVEVIFVGLILLHVYTITALVDLVILNPIWFWKAPNTGPIRDEIVPKEISLDKDHSVTLTFDEKGQNLRADLFERGRWIDSILVMEKMDGSMAAENANGKIRYESRVDQDGVWHVVNSQEKAVFSYSLRLIERRITEIRMKNPTIVSGLITGPIPQHPIFGGL